MESALKLEEGRKGAGLEGVRRHIGGVICLRQDNDEGAKRKSSAVHLLASGGNTLTLAPHPPPPPARLMTLRVCPGLPASRTLLNLVTVRGGTIASAHTPNEMA